MKQFVDGTKYYILILFIAFVGILYVWKDDIFAKTGFLSVSGGDEMQKETSGGDVSAWISGGDISRGDFSCDVSGEAVSCGDISGDVLEEEDSRFVSVTEDYFDDAVFIGDSRTVGLHDYGKMQNTTFYASTGLSVYKMFSAKIVKDENGKKITIEEALEKNRFRKIYIMIGINELGTGTPETFAKKYKERLDRIMELQPDAIIYIEAIMKVSTQRSNKGDYINNEEIIARNEALRQLADGERIFFLDVNPAVTDEEGGLVSEYSFDGVHLKAAYVDIWKNFLMNHAIE